MKKEINNYSDILDTFVNLIGYLKIITNFDSFSESKIKYENILETVTNWMTKYEKKRSLSFIDHNELSQLYENLNDLQTKYICNDSMGSESKFSDYALNWMQHLITIVKNNYMRGEK